MAFPLPTVIPLGSKSRVSDSPILSYSIALLAHFIVKWSGDNITHSSTSSGGIADSESVFNMTTAGSDFTLEIVTRAASQVLEVTEIEREIETTSTTVSLSVFSQQEPQVMLKREKPTILQTLWQQLQETLQIKPSSSRIMVPLRVRYSDRT